MKNIPSEHYSISHKVDLDFFENNIEKLKDFISTIQEKSLIAEWKLAQILIEAILNNKRNIVTTICKADVIKVDYDYPGLGIPFQHACLNAKDGKTGIIQTLLDFNFLSVMNIPIASRGYMNALEVSLADKKYQNVLFLLLSGANPFVSKSSFKNLFNMADKLAKNNDISSRFLSILLHIKKIEEVLTPALNQIFDKLKEPRWMKQLLDYLSDDCCLGVYDSRKSLCSSIVKIINNDSDFLEIFDKLRAFIKQNRKTRIDNVSQFFTFSRRLEDSPSISYAEYIYSKLDLLTHSIYANNFKYFMHNSKWKIDLTKDYARYEVMGEYFSYDGIGTSHGNWLPIFKIVCQSNFIRLTLGQNCYGFSKLVAKLKTINNIKFLSSIECVFNFEKDNIIVLSDIMSTQDLAISLLLKFHYAISVRDNRELEETYKEIKYSIEHLKFEKYHTELLISYLNQSRELLLLDENIDDKNTLILMLSKLKEELAVPTLKSFTAQTIVEKNLAYSDKIARELELEILEIKNHKRKLMPFNFGQKTDNVVNDNSIETIKKTKIKNLFFNNLVATPSNTHDGNTPLHKACDYSTSPKEFEKSLKTFDKETLTKMATTVNNKGLIPLEILMNKNLPVNEEKAIVNLLLPLTLSNTVQNISEPVDFNAIVKKYNPQPESRLYNNLKLACQIANKVRSILRDSSSHPQINGCKNEFTQLLDAKIQYLAYETRKNYYDILMTSPEWQQIPNCLTDNSNKISPLEIEVTQATWNKIIANESKLFKKFGVGNCQNFSYTALYEFMQLSSLPAKIVSINPGNHVVLVIDEGENAVLCDSWSGDIAPFSVSTLSTHTEFKFNDGEMLRHYNVVTNFNSNFHKLEHSCNLRKNSLKINKIQLQDYLNSLTLWDHNLRSYANSFFMAVLKGDTNKINSLLKAKRELVFYTAQRNYTALIFAVRINNPAIVEQLLVNGAEIDHQDDKGATALHYAAEAGYDQIIDILLTHNANVNKTTQEGVTALFVATQNGYENIVRQLLNKSADPNISRDLTSPAFMAAAKGHATILTLLINHGADINKRNKGGTTLLFIATQNGHINIIKMLLALKVDIEAQTDSGVTAAYIAAESGQADALRLLASHGAKLNTADKTGLHASFYAIKKDYIEVLKIFKEHNVDMLQTVPDDLTIEASIENNQSDLLEFLLSEGLAEDTNTLRS